jgi:hypothetical protein
MAVSYPWYDLVVEGSTLEQGDILEECPVYRPHSVNLDNPQDRAYFDWDLRDLIVLSQSCDMVLNRQKVEYVLMCALWKCSEFTTGHLATSKGLEDIRRGNLPAFHMLAECQQPGFLRELRIAEFHRTYSLPIGYVRERASRAPHLRLLSPYREHLSQAFARYFMRVGLPVDIPPFRE